jgi:hypothetical protein
MMSFISLFILPSIRITLTTSLCWRENSLSGSTLISKERVELSSILENKSVKFGNQLASLIIDVHSQMQENQKEILTKFWWEHVRFASFGQQIAGKLNADPKLK